MNNTLETQQALTEELLGWWDAAEDHSETPLFLLHQDDRFDKFSRQVFEASVGYVFEYLLTHENDDVLKQIINQRVEDIDKCRAIHLQVILQKALEKLDAKIQK
jgi:hypothetical protein